MTIAVALQNDLLSEMPVEQVFQKHVVDGASFLFRESLNASNLEYELRHELAEKLGVNINDVILVGSAKLGFSLKTRDFHKFDWKYSNSRNPQDKSDIDVAVINRKYFDSTMERIYHLSRHFDEKWKRDNWRINAFYKEPTDLCSRYAMYLAKGWMRPDLMPAVFYDYAEWRPVCDKWFKRLKRKISLGFYSDWVYLKHYQMDNLESLKTQLKGLEIKNV